MRLFVDCEYNDFRGALISMALVSESGAEWYEVLRCDAPSPWVAANVMPVLGKESVPRPHFAASLAAFLSQFETVHVVADWPEDIAHFCNALIVAPGGRLNTPPLTMEVVRLSEPLRSAVPHNALSDARAIRDALA